VTHTYETTGVKTVKIRGVFPGIKFNNLGDKLKILSIEQWGNSQLRSVDAAYYGCTNLVGNYTDVPNTTLCTNFQSMFRDCPDFNSPVENMDTSNNTFLFRTFNNCLLFDQSLANMNISNCANFGNMMFGSNALSTANYDATLIAWAAQSVRPSMSVHFGDAKYSAGAAQAARAVLASAPNLWTITDGGLLP
jgi:hypothetical protein